MISKLGSQLTHAQAGPGTAGRVNQYIESIEGRLALPRSLTSKSEVVALRDKLLSLQRVTVSAVARAEQANNFITKYSTVVPGESSESLCFSCDCAEFYHNGDVCPCVLVAADYLEVISFDVLLGKLEPRRAVGRPRRVFDGDCRGRDSMPSQPLPRHSANWFLSQIRSHAPLHYHKWQVARTFGSESRVYIGRIDTFRVLPAARGRGRAQGTKLWQIVYPDHPADPTEELEEEELAKALALAFEMGVRGPFVQSARTAAEP